MKINAWSFAMKIKRLSIIKLHFYLNIQTEAVKKLLMNKNLFQYIMYIYSRLGNYCAIY